MGDLDRPIFSSRADDPDLVEVIESFVVGLAERIDHLQDAEARRDVDRLCELARSLSRDASRLGFSQLGSCAGMIEASCLNGESRAVRKSVVEATEVARRIRLGHRGAV